MTQSQHTPGPWEACERGSYTDFDGNSRVICSKDMRLAVVQHYGSEEDEANAHLIAAAPELLEALENLINECWNDGFDKRDKEYHGMVIDKARAAIAKARGQS